MNNEKVTKSEEKKWLKVKKWPKKVTKSEEKKWRNFEKKMTKISWPVYGMLYEQGGHCLFIDKGNKNQPWKRNSRPETVHKRAK